MKRRALKRRLVESDTENENSFINNSDYAEFSSLHKLGSSEEIESNNKKGRIEIEEQKEIGRLNKSENQEPKESEKQEPKESEAQEPKESDEHEANETETSDILDQTGIDLNVSTNSKEVSQGEADDDLLLHKSSLLESGIVNQNKVEAFQQDGHIAESSIVNSPTQLMSPVSDNGEVSRLVIDKLVLTNFKSYAGEQLIGPFNASFSAVVGPNGSGKSNVIDALLFVFGFRASKMRQGKLSELIHNSTGGHRLDYCQVDIYFHHVIDNALNQDVEVEPNSALVVSRKAFKNNSSQYFINAKHSTYTEVTNVLKEKGIDLDHKRFLILQGEVESIAQMKPKAEKENDDGLLEYLEDIIGTAKYKSLIEENLAKVNELNEICIEKENRLNLVEKDKNLLEDRKNEALKFLMTENELTSKRSIQYKLQIAEDNAAYNSLSMRCNEVDDKLKNEKISNECLRLEIKKHETKIQNLSTEMKKKASAISDVNKKLKDTRNRGVAMQEKLKNSTNKKKKAEKSSNDSSKLLIHTEASLDNSKKALKTYQDEQHSLNEDLDTEKKKLDEIRISLKSKTSHLTDELTELQAKIEPWNDKLKSKENAIQVKSSSITILKQKFDDQSHAVENNKSKLSSIKEEGKKKEAELMKAESKLENVLNQLNVGEEQCNNERIKLEKEKSKLLAVRQQVQERINSISSSENKNKVLSSLTKLSKSGRIEGFYGRLGDLGSIDSKFDVAISTAAPGLDSLVVENVETAQVCIDYLRKHKIGYANFVCLDKLRRFDMSKIRVPGNPATVQRLFDLIQCHNEKFLPAFYSKMFDTLVASNLKEAQSVAYGSKRFRVVTLDGKLVDTSGTMSGGGNNVSKGAMRLSSSISLSSSDLKGESIKELKDDLEKMERNYEIHCIAYQDMLGKLRKLRDMKPELELEISKLQLDIDALTSERQSISNELKIMFEGNKSNTEISELDAQIKTEEHGLSILIASKDEIKAQMIDLETSIKSIEEKIMEAGGVELRLQNSKISSLLQKLEITNKKITNEKVSSRKLEKEILKHKRIIEESKADYESSSVESEKMLEQQRNLDIEVQYLETQLEEVKLQADELQIQLEENTDALAEFKSENNKFRSVEIELENQLENLRSKLNHYEKKVTQNQNILKSLAFREITPYIYWMPENEREKYKTNEFNESEVEVLKELDMNKVNKEIKELESYINNAKIDIEVLKEYGIKKAEFEDRYATFNKVIDERDEMKKISESLKKKRFDEFMDGFNTISLSLKEMYQMITMGGNAELELVDSLNPFSEGILFSVMPPKKSWKNISNLSGGEKTLSSLALVFALHKYKPTPLYVMDEIDAALDFRNVSIVANYIKERTKNAQFVVISLRNNMFELSRQLVGIYKVNNMTKSVSIENRDYLQD